MASINVTNKEDPANKLEIRFFIQNIAL